MDDMKREEVIRNGKGGLFSYCYKKFTCDETLSKDNEIRENSSCVGATFSYKN